MPKRTRTTPTRASEAMPLPSDTRTPLLIHNPRCSKSRKALELLQERGAAYELRLYLEDPLSRAELDDLRRRLGRPAREWVRRGEPAFAAAGLRAESDDAAVLGAIAAHPELLE